MKIIDILYAEKHFFGLLKQVEKDGQIIITKHGQAIAKLVSIIKANPAHIHKAIQRLQEFGKCNKLNNLDWKKLKDEGQK